MMTDWTLHPENLAKDTEKQYQNSGSETLVESWLVMLHQFDK